jgi:sugar lactone lactonase YvrE
MSPIRINLTETRPFGQDLYRPECVVACRDGSVFVPDWRGGITRIHQNGAQERLQSAGLEWLRPNSLTLLNDGSIVVAHLDDHAGGVYRLWADGCFEPVLTTLEGRPLPPTNFVLADGNDLWITVSTRVVPRFLARRPGHLDGYVVLLRQGEARVVADRLGFTNEVRIDPGRRHLYVVETFARRVSRYPLKVGGLGRREVFVELGEGHYPDGIAFDAEGALWATSIFSNRLLRITPDREVVRVLEDCDADFVTSVDRDYASGRLAELGHIDMAPRTLGNLSSIAFGGEVLRTLYLGCLLKDEIRVTRSPVAGHPMPHWDVAVPPFSGTT